MDAPTFYLEGNQPRLKVSISARLIPALLYAIPAFGGALSAVFLMRVMQALKAAETAGIMAVMGGMAESTIPVLVSLYLSVICGIIVIGILVARMFMETKTASPPSWFFIISGILCLVPAALFCEAESLIIEVIINVYNSTGIGGAAANISWALMLSAVAAPIVFILLIVASILPLSARKKPTWGPLIAALAVEFLLIAVTVAFQLRVIWLYQSMTG